MSQPRPERSGAADEGPAGGQQDGARRSIWRWIGIGLSLIILALTVAVVWHTLTTVDYAKVRAALVATSPRRIGLSLLFVTGSYLALTGDDALALRQLKIDVPYRTAALAAFTAYAISFTLGFPLVTGAAVRLWIYRRSGLTPGRVASLTVICNVTFWLGMLVLIAAVLAIESNATALIDHVDPRLNLLLGSGVFLVVIGYLVWVSRAPRQTTIGGLKLELPGFRLTLGQMALGIADLSCAAAALFVLLPDQTEVGYVPFLGAYVFGSLVGIASNVPGGLGAFETTLLKVVPVPSTEDLLASFVVFRVLYYGLPFALAALLLAATWIRRRWADRRAAG